MRNARIAAALVVMFAGIVNAQQKPFSQDQVSAKLRELYPDNADAKKEIAAALQSAQKDHKRVLLVFGANWCFDCFALDYRFHQPDIQPLVDRNYHVVHVDIGRNDKNTDLVKKYNIPIEKGIPSLAVGEANRSAGDREVPRDLETGGLAQQLRSCVALKLCSRV
jgi:thiol:disulfide interchange protein